MSDKAASAEEFGAGWSAILVAGAWIVLEPTDEPTGDPRPTALPTGLWCIVTSDNPQGIIRSHVENEEGRYRLRAWARALTSEWRETAGGVGAPSEPAAWPAYESGVLVPVSDYAEAVACCRDFDQAAVYVLDGDERVLVDAAGTIVRRQRYRVHRVPGPPADEQAS